MTDSFQTQTVLEVGDRKYQIYSLARLGERFNLANLPYSLKILLENLLRHEDGDSVTRDDIEALIHWDAKAQPSQEIAFTPARVVLQDFTGVPSVVDLAAMRDAMAALGGDPNLINPLSPAELVIDHSVQVDHYGNPGAIDLNSRIEYQRNGERYQFLRWGQKAFTNFQVVPPDTGIVHQVNLEFLARTVFGVQKDGIWQAYPDTLVGTDSHTTMINGLGVLGWGVGGIEAEAAMLGQAITMLIPQVIGFKLTGKLPEGATATDLVLTVVEQLRSHGVVGKFVEFFGDGLAALPLADRATLANMAPEYGATCGIFPIDAETLNYLKLSGRSDAQVALVEAYAQEQGIFHSAASAEADYSAVLELDMGTIVPSISGPKRPQDRILLSAAKNIFRDQVGAIAGEREAHAGSARVETNGSAYEIKDGVVVIAAITSCTNTSNPAVMLGAGLLARNAAARGLKVRPWVKTSLAPGSQVVSDYLEKAGLLDDLEKVGFYVVGYGCTTCIGNSGPLPPEVDHAVVDKDLVATAVLSGNRNFEGRIHPRVKMNYLASPPLVVAYALAGSMDIDLYTEPLGQASDGSPVYLRDIWPSSQEVQDTVANSVDSTMFRKRYADVYKGDQRWADLATPDGHLFAWSEDSTYIKNPPYFDGMGLEIEELGDIHNARCLAKLGDSITTDHISPAGSIAVDSPAGRYLLEHGVQAKDFNSYGSRRGNHEVMMRGTFANIRLRNQLAPGTEGGWTVHFPSDVQMSIFDAAQRYQSEAVPLIVLAGKEYGTGSSRDWAAKGTLLLGVKAVIAQSYERIHRSNLVGMGVLPLSYENGENADSLGLTGRESFSITGLGDGSATTLAVDAMCADGSKKSFRCRVCLDTPKEIDYFRHGGILQYVIRQLAAKAA